MFNDKSRTFYYSILDVPAFFHFRVFSRPPSHPVSFSLNLIYLFTPNCLLCSNARDKRSD